MSASPIAAAFPCWPIPSTATAQPRDSTPGEILLTALLENLGRRGFTHFDLGIGEAPYKDAVCDEAIELYDTVLAVSPAGALVAPLLRASLACKRSVKQTPWLLRWFERLRRAHTLQAVTA